MIVDSNQVRQGAGVFGILMAVVGVATGVSLIVWVAVGLLALSLGIRLWAAMVRRRGGDEGP